MSQFTLYCKQNCPYTQKATTLINEAYPKSKMQLVIVDKNPDLYKNHLSSITLQPTKTFPQVFMDGNYIGGFQDLQQFKQTHIGGKSPLTWGAWLFKS